MQSVLFRHLRGHYQTRDRLRLTVDYRRKFLASPTRGDRQEGMKAAEDYERAQTQTDKDYEELAAAADKKKN